MELSKVYCKDFCCFEELDLPIANNGLVWVSGVNNDSEAASSNGSGKSTIFKALVWGLYSQTIDGERGDNVIRDGATKAVVRVDLSDKEGTWIVQRTRTKGSTKLDLLLPDGQPFKASTKEIQQKIIDMLGLDFLAFRNTVLYGQNDINRFTNPKTTDAERKEMLHCILRSNIFSVCRDFVKEDKAELEVEITDLNSLLGETQARLEEHDLDSKQAEFDKWEEAETEKKETMHEWVVRMQVKLEAVKKKNVETFQRKMQEHDRRAEEERLERERSGVKEEEEERSEEYYETLAFLDALIEESQEKERTAKEKAKLEREAIEAEQEEHDKQAEDKRQALYKKGTELATVKATQQAKICNVKASLNKLEGDDCPVCDTPLDSKGVQEFRDELLLKLELEDDKLQKAEQIGNKLKTAIEKNKSEIEQVKQNLKALKQKVNKNEEVKLKEIETSKQEVVNKKKEATETYKSNDNKNKIEKLTEEINSIQQERLHVEREVEAATRDVEQAQEQYDEAVRKSEEKRENPYGPGLQNAREKVKEYEKKVKRLSKERVKFEEKLAYAEFWNKGFSNQGISSYMLDSTMPYLTERANFYLDILADGDIKVWFDTQKEMKSSKNEYRDKIDISWTIEGQTTSYPPSGGQAKKIEIATDLALMDLVSYREGHSTNILILDEVLDGLDAVGRDRVLRVLQEVSKFRNSVFVISHDTNMSEVFEHYISVEKTDGVSRVKEVCLE